MPLTKEQKELLARLYEKYYGKKDKEKPVRKRRKKKNVEQ